MRLCRNLNWKIIKVLGCQGAAEIDQEQNEEQKFVLGKRRSNVKANTCAKCNGEWVGAEN